MKYYILYLSIKQEINELIKLKYGFSMYEKRIRKFTK